VHIPTRGGRAAVSLKSGRGTRVWMDEGCVHAYLFKLRPCKQQPSHPNRTQTIQAKGTHPTRRAVDAAPALPDTMRPSTLCLVEWLEVDRMRRSVSRESAVVVGCCLSSSDMMMVRWRWWAEDGAAALGGALRLRSFEIEQRARIPSIFALTQRVRHPLSNHRAPCIGALESIPSSSLGYPKPRSSPVAPSSASASPLI